ncbi:MAG: serine protease [Candidatus Pacearchaeota archaeon]|jgi:hypothetical protein
MTTKFKQNVFLLLAGMFILFEIGAIFAADISFYEIKKSPPSIDEVILGPSADSPPVPELTVGSEKLYFGTKLPSGSPKGMGYMANVKIRENGNNYDIQFNENGALTRFSKDSSGKIIYQEYGNLKGKITFNKQGEVVNGDFQALKDGTFYLNGQVYEVLAGTQLKFENGEVKVNSKGESFSYYPENKLDKKQTFSNLKDNAEFKVNKDGKLVEALFEVSADTEINLRGYKYKLIKDSKVSLKDNQIEISLPDGTKVEAPEKTSDAEEGVVFSFKTLSGKALILPSGDLFESGSKVLYFDNDGFYFSDKNGVIKNSEGKEDFKIENTKEGNKVYLVFSKDDISKLGNKNSIFIGKNNLILTSLNEKGPAVFFAENNRYGIAITSKNTAASQAIKGKVFIEQGEIGKVASIKLSGNSISTLDKRSFYGENGKFYFDPAKQIESNFNYGDFSAAAKIVLADNNGNRLSNINFDVYANDRDQYASVPDGKFQSSLEFFKSSGNFYVSSSVAFNQLTFEQQDFFASLTPEAQQAVSTYSKNGEKDGASVFQRTVGALIQEEIKIRQNPLKASVRVPGGGGSGTIIGVDKTDGKAIILTAGHLGGATSTGYRYTGGYGIQLVDGRKFDATVLGGYNQGAYDYALIKIDQVINKIPYVPVASESHVVGINDPVLKIGSHGNTPFDQTPTRISKIGTNRIITTSGNIHGESGGGLFHNGRVIGVVETTGSFQGTNNIRNFLKQMGYDYLIKFIMVILN